MFARTPASPPCSCPFRLSPSGKTVDPEAPLPASPVCDRDSTRRFHGARFPASGSSGESFAPGDVAMDDPGWRQRALLQARLPQGFSTRCLRFARDVAAARARLVSGWLVGLCRERVELSGSRRKVSERSHVILLSRAYPVASWAHARRKLFEIAALKKAPIAIEAVRRIDALFAIEREINGMTAEGRRTVRAARSRPLVTALEAWLREHRAKLSAKSEVAKAIDYLLKRWPSFTRFLEDGRICLSNNAAERAIRGIAVGRRNWTFAGSDAGGRRAAALYTLIETAKLNDVDPRAWLADVLTRLPDHPALRLHELLPWAWKTGQMRPAAA